MVILERIEGGMVMDSYIISLFLGVIFIVIGISNTKGNIASIHWYHRKRVTEENRIPFGRMVGLGTIIIGISLIVFSGLSVVAELSQKDFYILVGTVVLVVGLVIGLGLSFYAMIKYNKGIF